MDIRELFNEAKTDNRFYFIEAIKPAEDESEFSKPHMLVRALYDMGLATSLTFEYGKNVALAMRNHAAQKDELTETFNQTVAQAISFAFGISVVMAQGENLPVIYKNGKDNVSLDSNELNDILAKLVGHTVSSITTVASNDAPHGYTVMILREVWCNRIKRFGKEAVAVWLLEWAKTNGYQVDWIEKLKGKLSDKAKKYIDNEVEANNDIKSLLEVEDDVELDPVSEDELFTPLPEETA